MGGYRSETFPIAADDQREASFQKETMSSCKKRSARDAFPTKKPRRLMRGGQGSQSVKGLADCY
jgi:hypothetical protein